MPPGFPRERHLTRDGRPPLASGDSRRGPAPRPVTFKAYIDSGDRATCGPNHSLARGVGSFTTLDHGARNSRSSARAGADPFGRGPGALQPRDCARPRSRPLHGVVLAAKVQPRPPGKWVTEPSPRMAGEAIDRRGLGADLARDAFRASPSRASMDDPHVGPLSRREPHAGPPYLEGGRSAAHETHSRRPRPVRVRGGRRCSLLGNNRSRSDEKCLFEPSTRARATPTCSGCASTTGWGAWGSR